MLTTSDQLVLTLCGWVRIICAGIQHTSLTDAFGVLSSPSGCETLQSSPGRVPFELIVPPSYRPLLPVKRQSETQARGGY